MKKKLILIASLVFVLCCFLAVTANAQCADGECVGEWVITGEESYLEPLQAEMTCTVCSASLKETIQPLFATKGFSYQGETGSITQHFAVDREAVGRFKELTGKSVKFGGVIAAEEMIGDMCPIDSEGLPVNEWVTAADFTDTDLVVYDIRINNIPKDARLSTGLICGAYVVIDGAVTFIDDGCVEKDAVANTYYDVVRSSSSWSDLEENEEAATLKVLTIGNSFSDDAMEYVYKIAKEAGVPHVELGNLRANSCSLATHLSNAQGNKGVYMFRYWQDGASTWQDTGTWSGGPYTIKQAVEFADWDYIVFQQVSGDSGNAATYDDLSALIEYVEPLCPEAKLAWHMTWSMRADYASSGPAYSAIVSAVNEKITSNKKIDVVIPSGTAIENAKTSYLTNVQIQRDAKHLSYGMGRYIAGLTFVKALTGLSVDGIDYPLTDTEGHSATAGSNENWKSSFRFTDEINAICIESANNAIDNPYQVTPTEYSE